VQGWCFRLVATARWQEVLPGLGRFMRLGFTMQCGFDASFGRIRSAIYAITPRVARGPLCLLMSSMGAARKLSAVQAEHTIDLLRPGRSARARSRPRAR